MDKQKIIESLSPNEVKVLPHIDTKEISEICKKTNLDKTSTLRALEFLKNKNIIELSYEKKQIIDLDINGILYKKKGLPERQLLNLLNQHKILTLQEAEKQSKLSSNEFKASLGALKKKAMIELKNNKIILNATPQEIAKKSLEEQLIEALPIEQNSLLPEQSLALQLLQKRKQIILQKEQQNITIIPTKLGKEIANIKISPEKTIEQLTPEILKNKKLWQGKKFRRYDVTSKLPEINGGKRHFVNQAIEYGREIWTEMGFKEMSGNIIQSSFWNFDALFTPQDHPVREMQDTFFLGKSSNLPDAKLTNAVKQCHEKGIEGSSGWEYEWKENESKKTVLRTHTTCLSAQTLSNLKETNIPTKFFSIGKAFRNETIDWSHGFEFYQTEGIVIDKNANFRHLLGYLKQFYKKMGFEKIRFTPAYFPYTEPSVEINVWHPEKKIWLELGGAGMFRPELTIPLLGKHIPVLAWGQGFDRIIMDYYKIKDLRELYKNDLTKLRKIRMWVK